MRALVPIDTLAEDVCLIDLGDTTLKYHMAVMKWMADAYRDMTLYMSDSVSIKTESMPADYVINMPCDFVEPTKVALKKDDRMVVLWRNYHSLNDSQHPTRHTSDLKYIQQVIRGEIIPDNLIPFYNYRGTNVLEGYSVGVNPSGWYDFNRTEGTITLGSFWPMDSEVVVEYKSDGISNGLELAPSEWAVALKEYAKWQYWRRKKDRAAAYDHKTEYGVEWFKIKDMYVNQPLDYMSRLFQNTPRQTINNLM